MNGRFTPANGFVPTDRGGTEGGALNGASPDIHAVVVIHTEAPPTANIGIVACLYNHGRHHTGFTHYGDTLWGNYQKQPHECIAKITVDHK